MCFMLWVSNVHETCNGCCCWGQPVFHTAVRGWAALCCTSHPACAMEVSNPLSCAPSSNTTPHPAPLNPQHGCIKPSPCPFPHHNRVNNPLSRPAVFSHQSCERQIKEQERTLVLLTLSPLPSPTPHRFSSCRDLSREGLERQIKERQASGKYGRLVTLDISAGLEQVC